MKIFQLISKVISILAIFGGTIIIIIKRYPKEVTTQLTESTSSLGLMASLFICAIVLVLFLYLSNGLKQSLRESKFGWLAIIFFGLVLGTLLAGIWFVLNSILISVQMSVTDYIALMEYHRQTVFYMMFPILGGICLGGISKLIEIDLVKKWLSNLI